jgi:hypothetical protein
MSTTVFGLDSTLAPAVFELFGSLVGGAAAIGEQFVSQIMIGYREEKPRRRRVRIAREIFAARVLSLARYFCRFATP